jgi:hypothetical protein
LSIECNHHEDVSTKINSECKKEQGRWTLDEARIYLEVLKAEKKTKQIIKELKIKLPNRIESQIRAHHQKMIKKYDTTERIVSLLLHKKNDILLDINKYLSKL